MSLPLLDTFTLIVVFVVANLLVVCLMLVAFHGRMTPVLRAWVSSLTLQALGWALMSKCGGMQPLFGFFILSISYSLMLTALTMYFGISRRYYWPWWPVLLTVIFVLTVKSVLYKQMLGHLIAALQVALAGLVIISQRDQRSLLRGLMGMSGIFGAAMLIARAADLYQVGHAQCLPSNNTPQLSLMFLSFLVFRFTFTFGFLLLIEGRQREAMMRLASLDSLTETYNRRTFVELANRELKRCMRNKRSISLLIFDLDHFKKINDSYGHQTGDHVLCHVKGVVQSCLRSDDLFARYGGEEFVVLLPETGPAGAYILAERLRQAIAEQPVLENIHVTASVGVAGLEHVDDSCTLDKLLWLADRAMYSAKAAGRNLAVAASTLEDEQLVPAAS